MLKFCKKMFCVKIYMTTTTIKSNKKEKRNVEKISEIFVSLKKEEKKKEIFRKN